MDFKKWRNHALLCEAKKNRFDKIKVRGDDPLYWIFVDGDAEYRLKKYTLLYRTLQTDFIFERLYKVGERPPSDYERWWY